MVLTSSTGSPSNENATCDRIANLSSAAASSSRGSARMARCSGIEQLLHGPRRIFEHVQAYPQQRRSGMIDLCDVGALLERRRRQSRGAKTHAALKLAGALGRRVAAGGGVGCPERLEGRAHRLQRL